MTSVRQLKNHSGKKPVKQVANSAAPYPSIITQVSKEDEKSSSNFDIRNIFKCCNMVWRWLPFKKQSFEPIEEAVTQGLLEPQLPQFHGKKTLVLDLDETLVHSTFEPVKNPDLVLPVEIKGATYRINVMIRPGTEEFLARMGELYEVVVFTASLAEYAEPLVKVLDTTNVVSSLLFRQHCTPVNGVYVKDLSLIGRDIKNVILVDNSPNSFLFQPENAYHIKNFFDDKTDRELDKLTYFLENVTKVKDVRPIEEHRARIEAHHRPHHVHHSHMKVVKINHESVPDQEQDQEQQELEQNDESSMVDLDDVSIIQPNSPSSHNMKKKEEKNYNLETEPDLRRDDREGEFPEVIVSVRNKDRAGLYANYAKAAPLTERVVVSDRLIPQALDSSVDIELPSSPKESDALINHREADAFFENNSNSSDSKESKNNIRSKKPQIPAFPKNKAAVFAGNNFVAVNDPALEGHLVEDVRFLTGIENLNSPLGKQVKIDLVNANKLESGC